MRHRADLHQRRHVGQPAPRAHQLDDRAERPATRRRAPVPLRRKCAGQRDAARASATVPSVHVASFRGLSPAPSHHLGVDVFVGTVGRPNVVTTSGVGHAIGPPLSAVRRPHAGQRSPARARLELTARLWSRRLGPRRNNGGPGLSPSMSLRDVPTAVTRVGRTDNRSQPSEPHARTWPSQDVEARARSVKDGSTRIAWDRPAHRKHDTSASKLLVLVLSCAAKPYAGVQAMCFVSDTSSMRGGRSTRASHQSRTRTLPPRRADASRIPSVHRGPGWASPVVRPAPVSDGGEVADEQPACHLGRDDSGSADPTKRRRRGRSEARTSDDLPKSPCRRATNSALGRPKSLQVSRI